MTRARLDADRRPFVAPVDVTADVRPGVVCLPHGWGHADPDAWGTTARERPGSNVNEITGSAAVDVLSGTSVLAGIPVDVTPA